MTSYCPKCGNKIEINSYRYCVYCGSEVKAKETKAIKRFTKIAFFIPILLILFIGILFLMDRQSPAEQTEPSENFHENETSLTKQQAHVSQNELSKLEILQHEIPYPVLIPTYLPDQMTINTDSISIADPASVATSWGVVKSYEFQASAGSKKLRFIGNNLGDPPGPDPKQIIDGVRGHKAVVWRASSSKSLETSNFYIVLWNEGSDFVDSNATDERYGAYGIQADNISWDEVQKVINSLTKY